MQETRVQFLGQEDPLEKEMATHSRVLTWDIPWIEESMGSKRVGHNWATKHQQQPELTKPSWVPPSNSSWTSNSFLTPMTLHYHHSSQVSRHQSCAMQFLSHCIWRCKKPSDTSLKLSSYLVHSLWDQLWAFRKPCAMSALHVGLLNELWKGHFLCFSDADDEFP